MVIKLHSLTLPALRAQNYIHELINENANFSVSLVAGIGSSQVVYGAYLLR